VALAAGQVDDRPARQIPHQVQQGEGLDERPPGLLHGRQRPDGASAVNSLGNRTFARRYARLASAKLTVARPRILVR
jgi:hypothetical protein